MLAFVLFMFVMCVGILYVALLLYSWLLRWRHCEDLACVPCMFTPTLVLLFLPVRVVVPLVCVCARAHICLTFFCCV